jgi:outer membrane protein TolC
MTPARTTGRPLVLLPLLSVAACWTGELAKESADAEVYPILEDSALAVTGQRKTFGIDRPIDTLRKRLLESSDKTASVQLSLLEALDVAAENSRDFQRQKEQLYLAALDLTRNQHDFALRWSGGATGTVSGTGDDQVDASVGYDLNASANTVAGTQIVAGFVDTFLRSLLTGGGFDGSSILQMTLTQPLLRGSGSAIVREPLTQAERDVVYEMRAFERFRATFAVSVVSDYYDVVQQMQDLRNVEANYESVRQSRERTEEEFNRGRRTISDLGRERQSELSASNQRVLARNQLEAALDQFKLTLGLPVTANLTLDIAELDRLVQRGVVPFAMDEQQAIALALARRYDHRTVLDQVEDAGRRVLVSEDALRMSLDFSAVLEVPAVDGKSLNLDWSKVSWAAGFDLDLALDKLVERNAYRSSLIALESQIRAREQSEDSIASAIRAALRNVMAAYDSYGIQLRALDVAQTRVESETELYNAGRGQALNVLDAKDALLAAQLNVTAAIVTYAVSRLQFVRDLEGLALEPQGLRFDPALPVPSAQPAEESP